MNIKTALLASLIPAMFYISPAKANDMQPTMTPLPEDNLPVVLPMQAKQPGDYNFQATVTAPPATVPFSGGKLGMITPVLLNGLKYVDIETGMEIPPPGGWPKSTYSSSIPPVPLPEPEPMPPAPPPPPQDHGRILSVGRDPYNPGGYMVTYQDGTVERVSPPKSGK